MHDEGGPFSASGDEALAWWRGLSDEARDELSRLFDPSLDRIDRCASGEALAVSLVGVVVEPEEEKADRLDQALMNRDLYEFIVNHEDIVFFLEERQFHICRSHARALHVLRTGYVPGDFSCPLQRRNCPWRQALAQTGGKSLGLRLLPLRRRQRRDKTG